MKTADESRRLVLSSGFANAGFGDFIARSGWPYLYIFPPGAAAATEYVWRIDPAHTFHYFECTNYPVEYCLVVGPQANEVLMRVSAELNFLDADDLAGAFDRASTIEEKEVTAYALGLSAGDVPDVAVAERVRVALGDVLPRVRLAAIDAAFVTGWETFRSDLERLSVADLDPDVRQTAINALAGMTMTGPTEGTQPA